jgi:hypothetical protein
MEIRALGLKGLIVSGGRGLAAFSALALGALLVFGCADLGIGGTELCGTEIPDPWEVAGCAELENGDPAVAVRVVAYPTTRTAQANGTASLPYRDSYVVMTEKHGLYSFSSLPAGEYDLFFEDTANQKTGDWRAHHLPNIKVKVGGRQTLPLCTLKTVGQLILNVVDSRNDAPIDSAECRIANTPYHLPPTRSGIANIYLPMGGGYRVECSRSPYTDNFQVFQILPESTKTVTLQMSQGDPDPLIPKPDNVSAVLDTASGIVRISWSRPASTELFEYELKRNETENPLASKSWPLGGDTVYYDAVFGGEGDTITSKQLQYSVRCLKRKGGAGDFAYGKPIRAVRGPSIDLKYLDTAAASCKAGDTVRIAGRYSNRFHYNTRVSWMVKSAPDTLRTFEVSDRSGADTLGFPCKAPGGVPLEMRVKDETGVTAIGRILVQVVSDP